MSKLDRKYFVYQIRLMGDALFAIWFTDEFDAFYKSKDGKIPLFKSLDRLYAYASEQKLSVVPTTQENQLDLDSVLHWLQGTTAWRNRLQIGISSMEFLRRCSINHSSEKHG